MKTIFFLSAVVAASLLSSCGGSEDILDGKSTGGEEPAARLNILPTVGTDTRAGFVPKTEWAVNDAMGVTRNFAASLFRNIKYFTLRKLYLCRKWMQKRLQKTTTTGITLPNFDFLA